MTHTSLVLGGNWPADEWPDYVEVEHDDGRDRGAVRYAPERTCRMEYQTGTNNPKRGWFECSECGGLGDSVDAGWNGEKRRKDTPAYCPNCGAKVVER